MVQNALNPGHKLWLLFLQLFKVGLIMFVGFFMCKQHLADGQTCMRNRSATQVIGKHCSYTLLLVRLVNFGKHCIPGCDSQ